MNAYLRGTAKQRNREIAGEGQDVAAAFSRARQLFTADWKTELILAGYGYGVNIGDLANAGGDVALLTGGGAGTVIDSDQPEMAVGIPDGYFGIPLFFQLSAKVDIDADAEIGNIALFVDTAKTIPVPIAASSTVVTPVPLLGGGPAAAGDAQTIVVTDITDPVASLNLGYWSTRGSEVTAAGESMVTLNALFNPDFPQIFKGPCSFLMCFGGTAAVTAGGVFLYAEVPADRFKV